MAMRRMWAVYEWLLATLCAAFGYAIGALILAMSADVVLRAFSWGSLPWVTELTEYVLYSGTFLGAAYVLRKGGHVRVDALITSLPRAAARRLDRLADLLGMIISAVMLYFGALAAIDAWANNMMQFKTWTMPEWILLLPIPIGCGFLTIEFALRLIRAGGSESGEYSVLDRPSI